MSSNHEAAQAPPAPLVLSDVRLTVADNGGIVVASVTGHDVYRPMQNIGAFTNIAECLSWLGKQTWRAG